MGAAEVGATVTGGVVVGALVTGASVTGASILIGASVTGFSVAGMMTTGEKVTGATVGILVGVEVAAAKATEKEGVVDGLTTGIEVLGEVVVGVGRDVTSVIGMGATDRTVVTGVVVTLTGADGAFTGICGEIVEIVFTEVGAGIVATGAVVVLFVILRVVGTIVDSVPTHPHTLPNRS